MHCRSLAVVSLILGAVVASGQIAQSTSKSDPLAVSLAQKSATALTGGVAISDVTLNGTVISIAGSENESGTGSLQAKGSGETRVDLSLGSARRSDVRSLLNGIPVGAWEKNGGSTNSYAEHNCLTDAAWFFPALSSLSQAANPNFIFSYVGQELHNSVSTQHIQVHQLQGAWPDIQRLTKMDFYLDPSSLLPLAVVAQVHPDNDWVTDIPLEINFSNYQTVNGLRVPFHIQQLLNGTVVLDFTVTSATFNAGLQDSIFTLP